MFKDQDVEGRLTNCPPHQVPGVSFFKKFNLSEFAPLGQDLVSVFVIYKESLYYRFILKPYVQELCWYMYKTLSVYVESHICTLDAGKFFLCSKRHYDFHDFRDTKLCLFHHVV